MKKASYTITIYDNSVGADALEEAGDLYSEVYSEPPYLEGPTDFANFTTDLPSRASQQDFRLIIARLGTQPLGFALGHQLPPDSRWWDGAEPKLPPHLTKEYPGRSFAIIELAVHKCYRRHGYGRQLHTHLIAGLKVERITLLVRPEAEAAVACYSRWGYRKLGQIRPYAEAPIYDSLILDRSIELP